MLRADGGRGTLSCLQRLSPKQPRGGQGPDHRGGEGPGDHGWGWKLEFNASLGQEIWPGACGDGQLKCGPLQKANTLEKRPLSLKMRLT